MMTNEKSLEISVLNFFNRVIKNYNLYLFVAILFFVISKWNALFLPYFWDEAWSYIPAIDEMIQKIPCLIPNCIDPELYRGHPLFFYFLSSFWAKIFENSLFALHSFALLVSILTIVSFFRVSKLFIDKKYALLIAVLLMLQEVFFVQSTFLLPEILITLLTLEAFYAYQKKEYIYFLLTASLLGITKESGIIILGVFALYHLINCILRRKRNILSYIWIGMPFIPITIFFLYQSYILGWFFFPLHTGMIDLSWWSVETKIDIIASFLFVKQGRWGLWVLLGGALLGRILFLRITKSKIGFTKNERGFLLFSVLFFVFYCAFSAANFLMLRYLLCLFPFILLFFSLLFSKLLPISFKTLIPMSLLIPFFIWSNYQNSFNSWIDDASINGLDMIKVHKETIEFIEKQKWYDKHINTHFLMWYNLTKPPLGYLSSTQIFENVEYDVEVKPSTDIVIISRIELKDKEHNRVKDDPSFELIKRVENKKAWCEIFMRQ